MDQLTMVGTKAKCRHLKKLTCRRTLRQVFIDWRYCTDTHVGIFDPALWTIPPLTFSLVQISPVSKYSILQTVCGWDGVGGVESCWGPYICRSLTLFFWPDSEPTKLQHHPKQKPGGGGGGGHRHKKTGSNFALPGNFFSFLGGVER